MYVGEVCTNRYLSGINQHHMVAGFGIIKCVVAIHLFGRQTDYIAFSSRKSKVMCSFSQPSLAVSLPFYSFFNHRQTALMSMINELGLSTLYKLFTYVKC